VQVLLRDERVHAREIRLPRSGSDRESRERGNRIGPREQREIVEREEPHACFGKWFTAKQTPANDENVLRKMFYVKTNGA
jgi:hypothetical protein